MPSFREGDHVVLRNSFVRGADSSEPSAGRIYTVVFVHRRRHGRTCLRLDGLYGAWDAGDFVPAPRRRTDIGLLTAMLDRQPTAAEREEALRQMAADAALPPRRPRAAPGLAGPRRKSALPSPSPAKRGGIL
jgi:hypothetical protein